MIASTNRPDEAQTPESSRPDHSAVIQTAWAQFRTLAEAQSRTELVADLTPLVERFTLGIFRLVVMGEIKKGKSSFINALLSQPDLLPIASDVATSTVFKLIYGPQRKFKVFFQPDVDTGSRTETLKIEPTALKDYGTEDGNPGNEKRVDFIGIELPHALLKAGLVIVDTPGVGGLFKAHRDITWRYAPNADAVCFVVDSTDTVITQDELDFLKELTGKVTKRIFFVQTKVDLGGIEQSQAWEKRNRELLTKHLGIPAQELLYFPVSSTLKAFADQESKDVSTGKEELMIDLDRSGFSKVMQFLNQGLMQQKEKQVAQETARHLKCACSELERELKDKLRIIRGASKEELDELGKQYAEAQQALEIWERNTYRDEMQGFGDKFGDLKQSSGNKLQTELDPTGPLLELIMGKLRSTVFDPEQINNTAGQLQQECLAQASQIVSRVQSEFNDQAVTLISDTAARLAKGFKMAEREHAPKTGSPLNIKIEDTLHMQFSTFENLRTGFYGGMAGSMMVHVVMLAFPPAVVVLAPLSIVASFAGAKKAFDDLGQRKREEVLHRLSSLLTQMLLKASNQARSQLMENATILERTARDTFKQATERARKELQTRLKEVDEARVRTRQEADTKSTEIEGRLKAAQTIAKSLAAVIPRKQPRSGGVTASPV